MESLFYRKKKYYRLNSVPKDKMTVSVDRGSSRFFLCFESVRLFEEWYCKVPHEERTLNEVITSNVRKLVVDIDTPNDALLFSELLTYDWVSCVTSRIKEVFFMLDIGRPEVMVYDMCSPTKISYHVIVSNFSFDAHTCMGLCMILSNRQIWETCVDIGIYKKVQCIRIEGSTKAGEKRWKKCICSTPSGSGSVACIDQGACKYNKAELSLQAQRFRPRILDPRGLISNLEGTTLSDIICNVHRRSQILYRQQCNQDYIESCIGNQFAVRKICRSKLSAYTTIFLQRTRPGFCNQCNRTHSRENAIIRYMSGKYNFLCWRWVYRSI